MARGFGPGRVGVLQSLRRINTMIINIINLSVLPFNGCRLKKQRRL
jgi:ribosomal protein S11